MKKTSNNYFKGGIICIVLFSIGVVIQHIFGTVASEKIKYPLNIVLGGIYISFLYVIYLLSKKYKKLQWFYGYHAALSSIFALLILTIIMGSINQKADNQLFLGFSQMTHSWSFVIILMYFLSILGLITIKRISVFNFRNVLFLLNHLGLFISILGAVLGNGDIQRYRMQVYLDSPSRTAYNLEGRVVNLDIMVKLKSFGVDEYPPKLFIVDNSTSKYLPHSAPQNITISDTSTTGTLLDWDIKIKKYYPNAARIQFKTGVKYAEFNKLGATTAAYIEATNSNTTIEGWVACGNYFFPPQNLALDKNLSIVMPVRDPKQFNSELEISKNNTTQLVTIKVNNTTHVEGWKIYQIGYDEKMGRWSNMSIIELVKDPWLPIVYAGIFMMLAGAIGLFLFAKKK